mmetsp:Transcript_20363/g.56648  ORF Transcript_20363/g.56648 Transcript_20363/m.56648 type:complete len:189 (-) Transcript_20363:1259-1825(-)
MCGFSNTAPDRFLVKISLVISSPSFHLTFSRPISFSSLRKYCLISMCLVRPATDQLLQKSTAPLLSTYNVMGSLIVSPIHIITRQQCLDVSVIPRMFLSIMRFVQVIHESKSTRNNRIFIPLRMGSKEVSLDLVHLACLGYTWHLINFSAKVEKRRSHKYESCVCSKVKCVNLVETKQRNEKSNICIG